jgi:hypothetical protein
VRRRGLLLLVLVAVAVIAVVAVTSAQDDTGTTAEIGAFPPPGTQTASPETQISLRGAPADQLGSVEVSGSQTGAHSGHLEAHSDGQGASFLLDKPLKGGETVTVRTELNIAGAKDGDYTIRTVARPKSGLQSGGARPDPDLLKALTGQKGKAPKGAAVRYKSRPDLHPPEIEVLKHAQGTAGGFVFIAPKKVFGAKPRKGLQSGPLMLDDAGRPVFFAANDKGNVTDFRVQQYQGRPVLTWWQGRSVLGTGEGVVKIVDDHYKTVATVHGGNGYQLDFHDTTITPQGTLLGIVFNPVKWDLRSVGGPKDARVVDAVVQEVDIATGLVMFEWHSLGVVSLREGEGPVPKGKDPLYDYIHPNSLKLTQDGNILLSGRETWAAYKLDRRTGRLLARYGGKKSDYKMLGTARFAWQHDVEEQPDGTLRIFDNEAAPKVRSQTRGLVLNVDDTRKTLSVKKAYTHKPDPLLSGTQGNVQALPGGHIFMGWGSQGYFTEFTADGKMLFDARIARGQDTYRAYRFPWTGQPEGRPAVAADDGGRHVYASFNGATALAGWQVLAGPSADALKPVASAKRSGFETRITLPQAQRYVAVQAKDASGQVIGTSKTIRPTG